MSYGFAALSLAYVIGGLAVLAALKLTFQRDYHEEAPEAVAVRGDCPDFRGEVRENGTVPLDPPKGNQS